MYFIWRFLLFILEVVIFKTLFWRFYQRCETRRWKWQGCFDMAGKCSYQRWNMQRWFNVVRRCKFQRWNTQCCLNVDLTLSYVATSYRPKCDIETTSRCLLGILKKEDPNDKTNFKLLSVLSLLSNYFKNVMHKQFYE